MKIDFGYCRIALDKKSLTVTVLNFGWTACFTYIYFTMSGLLYIKVPISMLFKLCTISVNACYWGTAYSAILT